ncbi:helix-turn-helix domain-containing protein [Lentzea albidocapillata]|uniref:helix-turn-helix domain-containing protein n=1 Tax=Lentzea albidocapillata TaxID=40571 RepID=UPI00118305D2|nr:helix-turn-helix domain-containing protein [Lentzea albidocapillata]
MAGDRSEQHRQVAADHAGPRRVAQPVVVPLGLEEDILRTLVLGLNARVRTGGGALPSAAALRFLEELHHASARTSATAEPVVPERSSASGTPPIRSATVDLLTVAEAAERLECSARYVRRLAEHGRITARRTKAGWLIDPTSLDTYRGGTTA